MQVAVKSRLRRVCPANIRRFVAALISLACLHPLAVQATSVPESGFRAGLCFSQTRPLTTKQQTALLKDLRRWTGFAEIQSDDDGFFVLGNRAHILGGSATARILMSAVVDGSDSYTVESHHRSPEVAFARIQSRLDYVNPKTAPGLTRHCWTVEIDFHDYQELRGQAEAISAFDPALNLLHELAHAVLHLRDSSGAADSLGDCERYINQIRRELGLPERQSYEPVKEQAMTPYGTGQRILGELTFVRIDPGKRIKKLRLRFDVENVFAACLVERPSGGIRVLARR